MRRGGDAAERGGGRDAGARDGEALGRLAAADGVHVREGARWLARMPNSRSVDKQQRAHADPRAVARGARLRRGDAARRRRRGAGRGPELPELGDEVADARPRPASAYRTPSDAGRRARGSSETRQRRPPSDAPAPARSPPPPPPRVSGSTRTGRLRTPGGVRAGARNFRGGAARRAGAWRARARPGLADAAKGRPRTTASARGSRGALFGGGSAAAAAAAPPRAAPPAAASASASAGHGLAHGTRRAAVGRARGLRRPRDPAPDAWPRARAAEPSSGAPAAVTSRRPPAVAPGAAFDLLGPLEAAAAAAPGVGRAGAPPARPASPGASTIPAHLRDAPR